MDSIRPRSIFPIVRGLPDHTDSGTYYVRAVIKRAIDDSVIETVNLVDKGNRYFVYNWEAPADVSGEGFYISITTSVYTDSGYTTKSPIYYEEFETYLVADRPNTAQILGGGGGGGISYKKLREIVSEVVFEALASLPKPVEPKEIDLSEIKSEIREVNDKIVKKIDKIEFPKIEIPDYGDKLSDLKDYIKKLDKEDSLDEILALVSSISKGLRIGSEKVDSGFKKVRGYSVDKIIKKLEKEPEKPEEDEEEEIIAEKVEEIKDNKPKPWYRTLPKPEPFYRKKNE